MPCTVNAPVQDVRTRVIWSCPTATSDLSLPPTPPPLPRAPLSLNLSTQFHSHLWMTQQSPWVQVSAFLMHTEPRRSSDRSLVRFAMNYSMGLLVFWLLRRYFLKFNSSYYFVDLGFWCMGFITHPWNHQHKEVTELSFSTPQTLSWCRFGAIPSFTWGP